MKNQVVRKYVTGIYSSDRVIYLGFNSDNQLIAINYQQGLDDNDLMVSQSNDPVLYTQLDCIKNMSQYTTDEYSLDKIAEIIDNHIWTIINIIDHYSDSRYASRYYDKLINNL